MWSTQAWPGIEEYTGSPGNEEYMGSPGNEEYTGSPGIEEYTDLVWNWIHMHGARGAGLAFHACAHSLMVFDWQ